MCSSSTQCTDICKHAKKQELKELGKKYKCKTDTNFKVNPTKEELTTPSKFRFKVKDPHNIPLWVRILGLYFDPKMYWKEHVDHIINRVKHKLYQLQRIANSSYFNCSYNGMEIILVNNSPCY